MVGMTDRFISGIGLATLYKDTVLSVWYPQPVLASTSEEALEQARRATPQGLHGLSAGETTCPIRRTRTTVVETCVNVDADPRDAADSYLRLHSLSHRLVMPNDINLTGLFGTLENVVWTSLGPCAVEDFEMTRTQAMIHSQDKGSSVDAALTVLSVDKFPRMTDFVLPSDVRIGDASRVRLGAYLAPGTVVMHEGFVNFNAGTLGKAMVEGRISQGVVIGDGTDIGGGASIMGTLSGGGTHRITIGRGSLLGANAGIGISLGNNCVVEAGLYITGGTKVRLYISDENPADVKAATLSGRDNLLFRRNSMTGQVEALSRNAEGVTLNPDLH